MGWNTSDVHGQFLEILLSLSIPIISEKRNSKAQRDVWEVINYDNGI